MCKVARELEQHWLDVEEATMHHKSNYIHISNLGELKAAVSGRGTRLKVTDVTQQQLDEHRAYYNQTKASTRSRGSRNDGGGDVSAKHSVPRKNQESAAVPKIVVQGISKQKSRHRRAKV